MSKDSEQKVVVVDSYVGKITQTINNFFGTSDEERLAQRNRRSMIKLIKKVWVEGFLEHSIHGAVLIELGLNVNNDLVTPPWDLFLGEDQKGLCILPPEKSASDIFDEANQSLLILGEPGGGKTTLILRLVHDHLIQAEDDLLHPIPVVFNLSSWGNNFTTLDQWLVNELAKVYLIPEKIAKTWIGSDEIALFLDGLDEVHESYRKSCVEKINEFRLRHGLCSIVVTARSLDYKLLSSKLNLNAAVVISPLTSEQVANYLHGERPEFVTVRNAIKEDSTLKDLARNPLMLDVMILAFQETSVEFFQSQKSIEAVRKAIFSSYIDYMFKRRVKKWGYTKEKTLSYLKWLANELSKSGKNYFYVEDISSVNLKSDLQKNVTEILTFLSVCLFLTAIAGIL